MFGLDFVSKTATHLVKTFEDNVRQGQQQLEKWLGDTGMMRGDGLRSEQASLDRRIEILQHVLLSQTWSCA